MPIDACVGRQPIRNVATPMISSDSDEHRLAADAVAEVTEDDAAQRPRGEADGEGAERRQRADQRARAREEQLAEDQRGGGPVEEEVVPLDRGADEACGDDLAQVLLVLCSRLRSVQTARRCHESFSSQSKVGVSRPTRPRLDTNRTRMGTPRRPRPLAQALPPRRSGSGSRPRRSGCWRCGSRSAGWSASSGIGPPVCVLFEGWDASGKGGAIKRLVAAARPAPRARRAVRGADLRREAPPLAVALLAGAAGLGRHGRARPLLVRARARRARREVRHQGAVERAPTTRSTTSSARWRPRA